MDYPAWVRERQAPPRSPGSTRRTKSTSPSPQWSPRSSVSCTKELDELVPRAGSALPAPEPPRPRSDEGHAVDSNAKAPFIRRAAGLGLVVVGMPGRVV